MASTPTLESGAGARAWEWIWRGQAVSRARQAAAATAGERALWQRARLAAELADRTLEPTEPLAAGPGHALALSLYREAAYWALRARQHDSDAAGSLSELWSAQQGAFATHGLSEPELSRVRAALVEKTFVETASDAPAELVHECELCQRFVHALLDGSGAATAPPKAVVRALSQRVVRIAGALLLMAALVSAATSIALRARRGPDLARGKLWSTSSKWADCHPERLECGGARTRIFFHTQFQKDPWFLLDLGPGTKFSRVEIENRNDCCQERAVPLIVEVSDDLHEFREVARRNEPFETWNATFPRVKARFLRLRLEQQTFFHLSRVSVRRD